MENQKILNGSLLARKIMKNLAVNIDFYTRKNKLRKPALCTILVGNNSASEIYINIKNKQATNIGITNINFNFNKEISEKELINLISEINRDPQIDGILVQLPLPRQIKTEKIFETIIPSKDVDGFHPNNVGLLSIGKPIFVPCTPKGCMVLLKSINVNLIGKNAVIVGRSNIVGKPMAQLLINSGATVTICNSKTKNLKDFTRNADILITATGIPHLIQADFVKPNSVILDVGISRLANGRITGDVDTYAVLPLIKAITPVPGGIGPMTLAMLMKNTWIAYKKYYLNLSS